MTFMRAELAPWLAIGFGLGLAVLLWRERRFYRWVEEHWAMPRSWTARLATWLWAGGVALLLAVLLDPRLGEVKVKGKVRRDRTIILIDTSTSMLAEDVKPNRLEKAALLAKHFVRRAAGHEIAVLVFADITKKLVPFTNDRDLLDARLDSVKGLRNLNAGSSIGLALEEAVRHFDPTDNGVAGNILVITDGEDNADTDDFKLPDGVSLALVGVGTSAGSQIPLKDSMGFHHGYKKERAVSVITKLDESFFKAAVKNHPNARYFLAQSYDLPTDRVLEFFGRRKAEEQEGDNLVRPVAMEPLAIPGLALFALGLLLRNLRPFVLGLALFMAPMSRAEDGPAPSPELTERLELFRQGKLNREERINLADQLVKAKALDQARAIYRENLGTADAASHPESYFNMATADLEAGDLSAGFAKYRTLEKALEGSNSPLLDKAKENVRKAVLSKQQDKKKQDKDKDKNKGQDNKEQEKKDSTSRGDGQSKPKQGQPGEKGEQGKEQGEKNPFDPGNNDEGEGGEEKKEQGQDPGTEEKNGEASDKESEDKKRPAPSPLLEQLKQDDRKLQLKLLDTSTQKRVPGRRKDW